MRSHALAAGVLATSAAALLCGCAASRAPDDPYVRSFRALRPSVVLITMKIPGKKKGTWDDAFGTGVVVAGGAWGSQIVTEEHVIADARDLHLTLPPKLTVPARIVVRERTADLALLETSAPDFVPATLGSSLGLEAGTPVGIAGFPIPDAFQDEGLGVSTSLYSGRIAAIRKDSLELDAPVIPGESGGPVFEVNGGTVVGLAESRFEEEKRIGFAIPVEDVKRFLKGKVHR